MRGGSLEADLALRDFTVNAIAEPLGRGRADRPARRPADLSAGRLRCAGPRAFEDDPLRVLRLVRVAVELDLEPDARDTRGRARTGAATRTRSRPSGFSWSCGGSSPRAQALRGIELMSDLGATRVVLPELEAMRGVEQSRFHHRDVYGHTLEVLERTIALTTAAAGSRQAPVSERASAEPIGARRGAAAPLASCSRSRSPMG